MFAAHTFIGYLSTKIICKYSRQKDNVRACYILGILGLYFLTSICFYTNIILHILVDTIVGNIHWLWPFVEGGITLVKVPATHDSWVYSFLDHWTFMVEVVIMIFTLGVFLYGFKRKTHMNT